MSGNDDELLTHPELNERAQAVMTTRTKEEQQLLDEKIARIQKKNEEILRRKQEIEEDKRMAEQQNAMVKLRPSTTNESRERTPALRPSNRELREDFHDDNSFQEPVVQQRSTRGSQRGRGVERYRGQADWKATGPPPDPRSFLYDDERDIPRDRGGKAEQRREIESERGRRDERDMRDEFRGGREFQRGGGGGGVGRGSRGGGDQRMGMDRGRRGLRGRRNRSDEEAWRAERLRIDEARIQRQRSADGKWRREWDNEKIIQEPLDEPRYDTRRPNSTNQEQWRSPPQHHSEMHLPTEFSARGSHRGGPQRGRGRGRLDPSELEMDKIQLEMLHKQFSPPTRSGGGANFSFAEDNSSRRHRASDSSPQSDDFVVNPMRSIECVGNNVKISIPNTNVGQSTTKPQRDHRGRFRSQPSYSSQSDDDSPRDRGQKGSRRQRNQKYLRSQTSSYSEPKPATSSDRATLENLPAQNKPPLPPFRSDKKPSASSEGKDGDESWEDVTTSGTESMGEEIPHPSKTILSNTVIMNSEITQNCPISEDLFTGLMIKDDMQDVIKVDPSDYLFDEYLNQMALGSGLQTSPDQPRGELVLNDGASLQQVMIEDTEFGGIKGISQLEHLMVETERGTTLKEKFEIEDVLVFNTDESKTVSVLSEEGTQKSERNELKEEQLASKDCESRTNVEEIKGDNLENDVLTLDTSDLNLGEEQNTEETSSLVRIDANNINSDVTVGNSKNENTSENENEEKAPEDKTISSETKNPESVLPKVQLDQSDSTKNPESVLPKVQLDQSESEKELGPLADGNGK